VSFEILLEVLDIDTHLQFVINEARTVHLSSCIIYMVLVEACRLLLMYTLIFCDKDGLGELVSWCTISVCWRPFDNGRLHFL